MAGAFYAVPGSASMYAAYQGMPWDAWQAEATYLSDGAINFNYQRRNPPLCREQYPFFSGWSRSCGIDGGSNTWIGSNDVSDGGCGPWGQNWFNADGGASKTQFIYAQIVDASAVPVAGARVTCFVTSTNQPDGQVYSDAQGNVQCPAYTPGVAHYLVAYLPGSPDTAATSVNTLTTAA